MARWRVAGFDLDGTLVTGTSILEFVGTRLGFRHQAEQLTRAYATFRMSNREVTEAAARFFAGRRPAEISQMLADIPTIDGIAESMAVLRRQGIACLLCTITFRFAADHFAERFGFDAVSGCELEVNRTGVYTGSVSKHFEAEEKREFIIDECTRRGASLDEACYFGDSRSDVPTFDVVGFGVALNATPEAEVAANVTIHTADLRHALALVPGLLDGTWLDG